MTSATDTIHPATYVGLAAEIVSAYVSNNPIPATELPAVIATVHTTLLAITTGNLAALVAEPAVEKPTPAQIRKSIREDSIVSFIDGKAYKTLKRHLTSHGLSPEGYRQRYGLPDDYPMVCASYSEQRSALAKSIGLGVPGARAPEKRKKAPLKHAA